MRLYEKWRPTSLDGIVGQENIVKRVRSLIERNCIGGHALLITGKSGQGKTTLARIIAGHLADDYNVTEFDAVDCTPARIGAIEEDWTYAGMGSKRGKAWIINECHCMDSKSIGKWLTVLERMPDHAVVIFTSTVDGIKEFEGKRDAKPFCSRCTCLILNSQGVAKPFAEYVKGIAEREGLNGKPVEAYVKLANDNNSNMRAMLQAIESEVMAD